MDKIHTYILHFNKMRMRGKCKYLELLHSADAGISAACVWIGLLYAVHALRECDALKYQSGKGEPQNLACAQ
jgi:hypothetical protein